MQQGKRVEMFGCGMLRRFKLPNVMPSSSVASGERLELFGGATLLRLGGHFPGSAVPHWAPGASGRSILCSGAPRRLPV